MPTRSKILASPPIDGRDADVRLNPFPSTGIARLSESESEFWSIETDALKEAKIQLQEYLRAASSELSEVERIRL